MDRLQAALGPGGIRRGGDALRPFRTHLAPGHRPFQQVINFCQKFQAYKIYLTTYFFTFLKLVFMVNESKSQSCKEYLSEFLICIVLINT